MVIGVVITTTVFGVNRPMPDVLLSWNEAIALRRESRLGSEVLKIHNIHVISTKGPSTRRHGLADDCVMLAALDREVASPLYL